MTVRARPLVAAMLAVAGLTAVAACGSERVAAPTASSLPATPASSLPATPASSSLPATPASTPVTRACVHPYPPDPPAVSPAVPGVGAKGDLASVWTLDGGQLTVSPAVGARPAVDRTQALCTLLAAVTTNGFSPLEEGSGLTLILGKVTIADQ